SGAEIRTRSGLRVCCSKCAISRGSSDFRPQVGMITADFILGSEESRISRCCPSARQVSSAEDRATPYWYGMAVGGWKFRYRVIKSIRRFDRKKVPKGGLLLLCTYWR